MKNHKNSFKEALKPTFSIWTILFLLLQIISGVFAPVSDFWKLNFQKQVAEAASPSWSSTYADWAYRKPIPLGGSTAGDQTNYQVPINPSIEEVFDKTGLVGDWNFDEGGGTVASDKSGSNNHGTLNSSSAWTSAGKFNSGFLGNGSTYKTTLSNVPVTGTGDWAISFWFKTSTAARQGIITLGDENITRDCIQIYIYTDNKLHYDVAAVGGPATNSTVTDGNWHYATVVNKGGVGSVYLDGLLNNSTSGMNPNISNAGSKLIGHDRLGVGDTNAFNGSIDETKIWNRALTADEIYKHYVGYANNSLVGSWHFSEGSGTTTADSSGQGNTGTITGATWAADRYGTATKALSFDGSGDYVDIPDNFSSLSSGTIEYWIKVNVASYDGGIESSKYVSGGENNFLQFVNDGGNNSLRYQVYGPSSGLIWANTPANSIMPGNWYHAVLTVDSSGNKIFINGVQQALTYAGYGSSSTQAFFNSISASQETYIGRFLYNGTYYTRFNGSIDEPKIYNRALTASEISERYRNSSKMRDDYGDLRFTNSSGTALDYWQETDSKVWVEVDSIPTAGTTIYQYYGNPSQGSASNIGNTFIFFDDFLTLDTGKWTNATGGYSISDGKITFNAVNSWVYIRSNDTFNPPIAVEYRLAYSGDWGGGGTKYDGLKANSLAGTNSYSLSGDNGDFLGFGEGIADWTATSASGNGTSSNKENLGCGVPGSYSVAELYWTSSQTRLLILAQSISKTYTNYIPDNPMNLVFGTRNVGDGYERRIYELI